MLYCSGSMCVGVTVWFGWGGVVIISIFRNLRLIVDLFHVLHCSGSMRVGMTVWFGWGGVVSLCRRIRIPHHPRRTTP